MTPLVERRTKLTLETPLTVQGRPVVAHVEPWGLKLRLKGCSHSVEITWAQIYNRAAVIAGDKRLAERKARRNGDGR
jgi:hypothetical protein